MKQGLGTVLAILAAMLCSMGMRASSQEPLPRLAGPIAGRANTALPGSRPPWAAANNDIGALPADTAIHGITLVLSRTAAQEAELQTLLAAQQNPASPLFHQWLTPEAFSARFGVADADIAAVQAWLQSQGFTVEGVARSRDRISFSGDAAQVAAAFGTELRRFQFRGETHFAPASDLALPASLAPMVSAVLHLSDLRPRPRVKLMPRFTSGQTQAHFLTPKDVATQYDVNPVYNAGYRGSGQSIAIVGQSYIESGDLTTFQVAAGFGPSTPMLTLVPSSGGAARVGGDEGESDLDMEYASAMAPGANMFFVYVGNAQNHSVFDALAYAITEDIAPVISISYGTCEPIQSATFLQQANALGQQASAQGQTIVAAAGDQGSTDCAGYTTAQGVSVAQQQALAADFPSSSPYVLAVGGLQMAAGTTDKGASQYWMAANGSDVVGSLLKYVPEVVWNEDSSANGISSGGGGSSIIFPRPSWQAGVPGIPSGNFRLVPDLAIQASTGTPGFVFCTSDATTLAQEGLTSSCLNGFRDGAGQYLTLAGGTSFSSPIVAGLLAVLNQAKHSIGQGDIHPVLYGLAANPATYAAAFHDITSGSNACTAGPTYCSTAGASAYSAGTGYDEASGLGSFDFANLVAAWPAVSNAALISTTTQISSPTRPPTPAPGSSTPLGITVSPVNSGSVQIIVDGSAPITLPLGGAGNAAYTYVAPTTGGSHVVVAKYLGDATHAPSSDSLTITNYGTGTPSGSFAIAATNLTVNNGSQGNSTVTVTPASGYNGTVVWSLSSATTLNNACYGISSLPVPGTGAPATTTLNIGIGSAACSGAAFATGGTALHTIGVGQQAHNGSSPDAPWSGKPVATVLAGLLAMGFLARRRSRRLPMLLSVALVTILGLGLSGCGSSSVGAPANSTTTPNSSTATPGSYNLTLTGMDSVSTNIISSAKFTLTVK